ncbi:MAG: DUF1611 domain-containing protein [Planctomycetes bacterium]|nr:DUF1611 domain-containing protein [Planctomycetota bacterium]
MPHLRTFRRLAVLTEGGLDIYRNKTAMSLLRFRPEDVVCVIDSKHVGMDLQRIAGVGQGIPIVSSVDEALPLGIEWLVIGVATPGGFLPKNLRPQLYEAMRNKIGVISGLHESVDGDPNLVSLSARYAVELVNLRKVPDEDQHTISTGKARSVKALRVLTVGTDTNIGKTTTSLSLDRYLRLQKVKSRFVATGQDGIMITGRGLCIDRVISDFCGGAVEKMILHEAKGADVLVIEGQNSILSPCYSGSALSLLHGSCPDAMILCHAATRTMLRHTDVPVPPLARYIELYEAMLAPIHPGKVVAVAMNTSELDDKAAAEAIRRAHDDTGLPVADLVREGEAGCKRIADAVLRVKRKQPSRRAAKG